MIVFHAWIEWLTFTIRLGKIDTFLHMRGKRGNQTFMQVKERAPGGTAGHIEENLRRSQNPLRLLRHTYREHRWLRGAFFVVIAAVCAAFFYAYNLQTALIADDFNYLYIFGGDGQRVERVSEIFFSMRNHYNTMNGRLVLHFLTQLFLLWGKPVFNLVNTLGYLLFTGLIYWHCRGTGRHSPALYFGVHLLVWFLIPVYGQTMLWVDGSANYMWGSILRLAVLLPFRLYAQKGLSRAGSWWWLLLSVPAGVIAGWTNENSGAALVVMMALFLIYYRIVKIKTPRWGFGALGGAIAGFAAMICAPGNHVRVERNFGALGMLYQRLWDGLTICNRKFFYYVLPILALFAACLVLFHFFGTEARREKHRRLLLCGVYLLGSLAGIYAMLLVPYFPGRAMFGSVACAIVAVGTLCSEIRLGKTVPRVVCALVFAGCMAVAAVMYGSTYANNADAYRQLQEREACIEREKAKGNYDVSVKAVRVRGDVYSPYYGLADVEPNPQHWANTTKARYYGLHSLSLKK